MISFGIFLLVIGNFGCILSICDSDYCSCDISDDGVVAVMDVVCDGGDDGTLELTSEMLPTDAVSITLSNFAMLTVDTHALQGTSALSTLAFLEIKHLILKATIFTEEDESSSSYLESLMLENIGSLSLSGNTFDNAPQMTRVQFKNVSMNVVPSEAIKLHADTMKFQDCTIGELHRESVYSDSVNFIFVGNSLGTIRNHGISGSNNVFNFSFNHVEKLETNAFSVAFLTGDFTR